MALFDDTGMMQVSDDYATDLNDWQPTARSDRSPPATTRKSANLQLAKSSPSEDRTIKKEFRRKDPLVIQQGELWEIEQGFIKALTWDEQGCVLTLGIWGPGDSVGLPLGNITPYEIICMGPVKAKLHQLQSGYPYEFLWDQAQQSQELLGLFRCRCIESRLLGSLWWLASRFGTTTANGQLTGITLTHQELADLIGSTRVTITRMLRQLEESGKLERVDRQFLLKDTIHNPKMRSYMSAS